MNRIIFAMLAFAGLALVADRADAGYPYSYGIGSRVHYGPVTHYHGHVHRTLYGPSYHAHVHSHRFYPSVYSVRRYSIAPRVIYPSPRVYVSPYGGMRRISPIYSPRVRYYGYGRTFYRPGLSVGVRF